MPVRNCPAGPVELPLRVGFVTPEYRGAGEAISGGIASYVRQMAHSLRSLGHEPAVLLYGGETETMEWDDAVPVYRLAISPAAKRWPFPIGRGPSISLAFRLAQAIRELRLQVLEVPEVSGASAFLHWAKPAQVPVVVRLHTCTEIVCRFNDNPKSVRDRVLRRVFNLLEKKAIRHADAVSAVSATTAELTRQVLGVKRDDCVVVPNPVAEDFYDSAGTWAAESSDILFFGRYEWRKGPDRLLNAFPHVLRQVPAARLIMVGEDTTTAPDSTSVLQWLRRKTPDGVCRRIEFRGPITHGEVRDLLRSAAVCVFPSRWEGCSVALAEAMAAGRAVVAADVPGLREYIAHGSTGLLANADDAHELGAAISQVLTDSGLRTRLGRAAHEYARQTFAPARVTEAMLRIYREAICGAQSNGYGRAQ